MKNKTLARVRVRVGVSAWIKIYIHHTENTELLPKNGLRLAKSRRPWINENKNSRKLMTAHSSRLLYTLIIRALLTSTQCKKHEISKI